VFGAGGGDDGRAGGLNHLGSTAHERVSIARKTFGKVRMCFVLVWFL
jgi:hypothetical protein